MLHLIHLIPDRLPDPMKEDLVALAGGPGATIQVRVLSVTKVTRLQCPGLLFSVLILPTLCVCVCTNGKVGDQMIKITLSRTGVP